MPSNTDESSADPSPKRAHEKPYICVDIDLARHDRLLSCSDPGYCLGLWVALAAYVRENLPDGGARIPKMYAHGLWEGVRRNVKLLQEMVAVDLLADVGSHYVIQRYAPRNQTKEMVEESRRKARDRMRTKRGSTSVRANISGTNGEQGAHVRGLLFTSPSLSGSDLSKGECERESGVLQPNTPIPDELREAARMLEIQDIESAWLKFTGDRAGHVVEHLAGAWQAFCASWRGIERRQRDRDRQRANGFRPEVAPIAPPKLSKAERQRRDSWDREALGPSPVRLEEALAAIDGKKGTG